MELITTTPERRQVARVLTFDGDHARYIDWNAIARDAQDLGAHFEARSADDGSVIVTMFWTDREGDCTDFGPDPERRD
jgi:hypothetical protein